jgi:PAS domain S-box-containing protein
MTIFSSVRGRLLSLAFLATLPLVGLVAWNALQVREVAISGAEEEMARGARLLAEEMADELRATISLLEALAVQPDVRDGREPACGEILRGQAAVGHRFANFLVIDHDGRALCGALPTMQASYTDREYFQRAIKSREPLVARPIIGRPSGRAVVPVAIPVLDTAGVPDRVIVAGLDLTRLLTNSGVARAVRGAAVTIWDREGTILFRNRDNDQWFGKKLSPAELAIGARSGQGAFVADGPDGVERVYAVDGIADFPGTAISLSIGLSRADLTAPANRVFLQSLAALALVVASVLAGGFFLAERMLRRPVAALDRAQQRLASGDLSVRVPVPADGGELGRLMSGFNDTVAALGGMDSKLRELNADLEKRVAERTAALDATLRDIEDLYDNAPCGYHSLDADAYILRMNATELRWLGYRADEVVGRMKMTDILAPHSLELFARTFPEFIRTGHVEDLELDLVARDGSLIAVSLSATAVTGEDGRFVMSRSVAVEIGERRRAAEMIAQKNEALARASEMKSQFLATMSHELRTPLNAIIGFAEVLKDGLTGELTPEQKGFVADIHGSGRHLLSLINDILDLSKVEAGAMKLDSEAIELGPLLQGTLSMVRESAMKRRIALDLSVDPGLPEFAADPRKVKQIVFNLLSNAVKFTPENGRVTISARRVARGEVGLSAAGSRAFELPASDTPEFAEISVADTGIGIARENLDRLFEPFVQIDSSLARQHHGTGLGLALVRRLAELHGGTVGIASTPGHGTAVSVWLPLLPVADRAAPVLLPPRRTPERAQPLALVVEDDDLAARLIEEVLVAEGFRCVRAATAEEGLVVAARDVPDLVTLDVFLPHMDGWEFLSRLKANSDLAGTPIVIVSIAETAERGLALGATRVLQKPFSRGELRAVLSGIIPTGRPGAPGTVLVVDDNPRAVELLATCLAGDYRVLRAYGGLEAVTAAQRSLPGLILLDLLMPDLNGFDVIARLNEEARTAAIPVIVVTAKDLTDEDRAVLNRSVARIIRKTDLSASDLAAEVRRILQSAGPAQG